MEGVLQIMMGRGSQNFLLKSMELNVNFKRGGRLKQTKPSMRGGGGGVLFLYLYFALFSLQAGFIRHTVNKITFSEQCYYVFGDLCGSMS